MTEDQVRDKAGKILDFQDTETTKSGGIAVGVAIGATLGSRKPKDQNED